MISSETPYKLDEVIRDTWPGLYRPPLKGVKYKKIKEQISYENSPDWNQQS